MKAFASRRVVLGPEVVPAVVVIRNGIIEDIIRSSGVPAAEAKYPGIGVEDFGDKILMPGAVDTHVHVDEPGRTHWEGFWTATRAAAAGGVTTIIDMPLNSIPPTTTVENLWTKVGYAEGNVFVDVGFWGGAVPENAGELREMVRRGVVGFKCFLCPSGTDEFRWVTAQDVERALEELKGTNSVVAFHAEFTETVSTEGLDPKLYSTFLRSRPPSMEVNAIRKVAELCRNSNVRCHIVHLSAAEALDIVREAKRNGVPLTAETCHHYLALSAEEIPKSSTQFKCCPPIRSKENQDKLWEALGDGTLDMIVSDHSPCTPDLKTDDFLQSWGGISSLQFGLPVTWTEAKKRGLSVEKLVELISTNPAKLCGFESKKGEIAVGKDADFVVWDPNEKITVKTSDILYKNKISPYEGRQLYGKIYATILAGEFVYRDGKIVEKPMGKLILPEK